MRKLHKNKKIKILELQKVYYGGVSNILKTKEQNFKDRLMVLFQKIENNVVYISKLCEEHRNIIGNVSNEIKNILDIDSKFMQPHEEIPKYNNLDEIGNIDYEIINNVADKNISQFVENSVFKISLMELKIIYLDLCCAYESVYKVRSIVEYLKLLRNNRTGIFNITDQDKKKIIHEITETMISE